MALGGSSKRRTDLGDLQAVHDVLALRKARPMTTTRCQNCNGTGWRCAECGASVRAPESRARRDYGRGCLCYGERSVRCVNHTPTSHVCDTCGLGMLDSGRLLDEPRTGAGLRVCALCAEDWQRYKSVAFDQWQTLRRSPTTG